MPPVNLRPSAPLDLHTFATGQHTPDQTSSTTKQVSYRAWADEGEKLASGPAQKTVH